MEIELELPDPRVPLVTRADCVGLGLSVKRQAQSFGWSEREAAEISLLVIELTTNAVRHAGGGHCTVACDTREVRVEVEDDGPGFPAWIIEGKPAPESLLPRPHSLGAGLSCARRMAHLLRLENRQPRGARAVASRYRLKPQPATEMP
jgi:anti-sigma regulatory factor (Ser/Thr protein kinase)